MPFAPIPYLRGRRQLTRVFAHLAQAAQPHLRVSRRINLASRLVSRMGATSQPVFDVIVIGAGMSGLACAAKLLNHASFSQSDTSTRKRKTLAVLEARDRIGGRIGSVHVGGARLDTGANWIHGVGDKDGPLGVNPLVDILPEKKFRELSSTVLFHTPSATDSMEDEVVVREAEMDGEWVSVERTSSNTTEQDRDLVIPAKDSAFMYHSLWTLIGSLHERAAAGKADDAKNTSLLDAIRDDDRFKKAFDSVPRKYHETLAALPQFIENMEAGPLASESSPTKTDASLGLLEFAIEDFDGEQVFLRDGYTAVVEEVGREIVDQGHLKLRTEVESIEWSGEHAKIRSTNGVEYRAKTVVCTLPLGVLQHHLTRTAGALKPLFLPALPTEKVDAIQQLGFGTLDKVFLVYDKSWWTESPWCDIIKKGLSDQPFPEDPDSVSKATERSDEPDVLGGLTDELPGLVIGADGSVRSGARLLSLINLHTLTGFPVLSCFVSCANALHMETLSDDDAGALVGRALARWLGDAPPAPRAVHVTRWAQDEYSRGSYSHMIAGLSETRHRDMCGQHIVGAQGAVVRFAGEHTSHNHFATVHGALLSGWREAEAMLAEDEKQ